MQLDVESIIQNVKCQPYETLPSRSDCQLTEVLDCWLPPILPEMIRSDFLEFFANKVSGRLGWLRSCIDSSFTNFRAEFDIGGYRGLADFVLWDDNLEGHFLERMVPLLQAIANSSSTQLSLEQFVALATDLCQWASFPLAPQDVSIMTTVDQMPEITVPALSRLLHTPYKTTYSRWKRLTQLNILRVTMIPNYRSIGLQPVMLELRDLQRDLSSPYLLSKIGLTGDGSRVLYTMVIPEEDLGAFSRWTERSFGTAHSLYLAERSGRSIAFTHYQFSNSRWDIDWRKLFIGAHLLHTEPAMGTPQAESYEPDTRRPYVLDEKDTRLIPMLMSDANSKLEALANRLSMSLSQVSRRKHRLTSLGILRPEPVIRRVGLFEEVVMKANQEDLRLLGIVRELPQTWTTQLVELKTGKKQTLVYATLPAGSFAVIRYYQRRYLPTKAHAFLSETQSGGWPLSFRTYDVEQGCWKWSNPVLTDERPENVLPFNDQQSSFKKRTKDGKP
jgi:hypothetical protein